jgi:hypothetical protein
VTSLVKKAIGHLQAETGMPYVTARSIVEGTLRVAPRSKECRVVRAARLLDKVPSLAGRIQVARAGEAGARPCTCAGCLPGDEVLR